MGNKAPSGHCDIFIILLPTELKIQSQYRKNDAAFTSICTEQAHHQIVRRINDFANHSPVLQGARRTKKSEIRKLICSIVFVVIGFFTGFFMSFFGGVKGNTVVMSVGLCWCVVFVVALVSLVVSI